TVYFIREIPKRNGSGKISVPSTFRSIWEGWRFIGKTPVVHGLVIGMLGAFAGAGVVVGLGYPYITYTLHGGSAGWGLVFAAIFVGTALSAGLTKLIASLNGTGNVKIGNITYASAGQNVVILLAALVAFLLGIRAYRQMDDRRGIPLRDDLLAAVRSEPLPSILEPGHVNGSTPPGPPPGRLIA